MNNKGFMMAEVIVVSAIILVTLVGLYTSYNKIFSLYNQRVDYYDVTTLYELANIRDNYLYPEELGTYGNALGNVVYYVNKNEVKNKTIDTDGLKQTFKDYLDYLSSSIDFNDMKIGEMLIQNMLIMEKCSDEKEKCSDEKEKCSDENNCKYAYLEVLDDGAVIAPECSLSISGETITASVNRDEGIAYIGWDTNRLTGNGGVTTSIDSAGTYTYSIEDTLGNVATCSVDISEYVLVDTKKPNCSSSNWSNKKSACSSGYSYSSNSCSRSVSSYTVEKADCYMPELYDGVDESYVWRKKASLTEYGVISCSEQVSDGSACTMSDYNAGTVKIINCKIEGYNYSGIITCKKYECEVDGHTRIDDTDYCYKIN